MSAIRFVAVLSLVASLLVAAHPAPVAAQTEVRTAPTPPDWMTLDSPGAAVPGLAARRRDAAYTVQASDTTLSALSVDPVVISFDPATVDYTASVAADVAQVTVAATTTDSSATAAITPATDADTTTAGHQVDLAPGAETTITVVVTGTDSSTRTYTVAIRRDSAAEFGWVPTKDIDISDVNHGPGHLWGNDDTIWISSEPDNKLFAYDRSTKARDSAKDITLHRDNRYARGIWGDGTTIWVADANDRLYAYRLTDDPATTAVDEFGTRDTAKQVHLAVPYNGRNQGLWSDGMVFWMATYLNSSGNRKVHAHSMADGSLVGSIDVEARSGEFVGGRHRGNTRPNGVWSDGTTIWVSDDEGSSSGARIFAYDYRSQDTYLRGTQPGKRFDTLQAAGNDEAFGIWSDGVAMWVLDTDDRKLYAYNMPTLKSGLSALSVDPAVIGFGPAIPGYRTTVAASVARVTVAATAADSGSTVAFTPAADADTGTAGHQVDLAEGVNTIEVAVTGSDSFVRTYTAVIVRTVARSVSEDASLDASVGAPVTATGATGYTLGGADASKFAIDSSGQITLKTALDYESRASYKLVVTATGFVYYAGAANRATEYYSQALPVVITVSNVDEAGTVSFDDASPRAGDALGASLADPDGGVASLVFTWHRHAAKSGTGTSLVTGASYTPVAADVGNYLRAVAAYTDAEGSSKTAEAFTDNTVGAAQNSPPEFDDGASTTRAVPEDAGAGDSAGAAVGATDGDSDPLTYTLSGADAARFTIDAGTGQIKVGTSTVLDFEAGVSYSVTVSVSDSKAADHSADSAVDDTITVTISVSDVDEAAVVAGPAAVDYAENGTGAVGSYTAADPEGLTPVGWSVAGADAALFEISAGGVLSFRAPPDFETPGDAGGNNVYDVVVVASVGAAPGELAVAVAVTDVSPVDTSLAALSVSPAVIAFDAGALSYSAAVPASVTRVTVAAAPAAAAAAAVVTPEDADPAEAGHQVDLASGVNAVVVTVRGAEDTSEPSLTVYRVYVWRRSAVGAAIGRTVTDIGSSGDGARGVVLQPDGRVVAAGKSGREFAVVRYNADGSLDTTFSGDGRATTDVAANNFDQAFAVVLQPDGKIVAAGEADGDLAVVRYNADGSLDTAFGGDGKVVHSAVEDAFGVVLQPDGKIVAVGESDDADFGVVRYNTNGSLDTGFGSGGRAVTDIGADTVDVPFAVALQPDNKIVAAGDTFVARSGVLVGAFVVVRYNTDGSPDTGFGSGGKAVTVGSSGTDGARAVVVQSDGRIVAAGKEFVSGSDDFALVRYNTDGSLDTTFGVGGRAVTDIGDDTTDVAHGVALQSDGRIVAAGSSDDDFALVRYNTDGSLDTTFGVGGRAVTDIGDGSTDVAYAVAVGSGGTIVAAGSSGGDFALVRYSADGYLRPGAPVGVKARSSEDGQSRVSWTPPPDDGGALEIAYTVTSEPGARTCASSGAEACTVEGLANGASYAFAVVARNAVGESDPSQPSEAAPAAAPQPPTGVAAAPDAGTQNLVVSWTPPTDTGGPGSPIGWYEATALPGGEECVDFDLDDGVDGCTITGLVRGRAYRVSVVAVNTNLIVSPIPHRRSAASELSPPATVPAERPGKPTGVTATGGHGVARISWTAPADSGAPGSPIVSYEATASSEGHKCATVGGGLSCTVTGLTDTAGTDYTFKVTATNSLGLVSDPSDASDLVTPAVGSSQVPATGVTAAVHGDSAVVSWTAPSSTNHYGYQVSAEPGPAVCTAAAADTSCTVRGLAAGRDYTFTVTTLREFGEWLRSATSAAVPAPPGPPGAPTGVEAVPTGGGAVVSWAAPDTDGGAAVAGYVAASSQGQTCATDETGTWCSLDDLPNGAHTFTVTARNAHGESPASEPTPVVWITRPTNVRAAPADPHALAVSWTAPTIPPEAGRYTYIEASTVTSSPGQRTCDAGRAETSCTVTGLVAGRSYTFTVTAGRFDIHYHATSTPSPPTTPSSKPAPATDPPATDPPATDPPATGPPATGGGNTGGAPRPAPDDQPDRAAPTFSDVAPDAWYAPHVKRIAQLGITAGCNPQGTLYCPNRPVTRAQMAALLVRALRETPAQTPTGRFADVAQNAWYAPHAERIAQLGITVGCNPQGTLYCPDRPVTRAQMALFIQRALNLPPAHTGEPTFDDVDAHHHAHQAIEAINTAAITTGCRADPKLYCPQRTVTRAQMVAFLDRALTQTAG